MKKLVQNYLLEPDKCRLDLKVKLKKKILISNTNFHFFDSNNEISKNPLPSSFPSLLTYISIIYISPSF